MKLENFEEAKDIVEKIKKIDVLLRELDYNNRIIEICSGSYRIIIINADDSSGNEEEKMAIHFIEKIKEYHNNERANLFAQLKCL
ncbi:MAG TPA: hypothetical protein PLS10_08500 [Chitinophagales bacterium]|nr:hypothetical protein [Chitinophagales bacterium]